MMFLGASRKVRSSDLASRAIIGDTGAPPAPAHALGAADVFGINEVRSYKTLRGPPTTKSDSGWFRRWPCGPTMRPCRLRRAGLCWLTPRHAHSRCATYRRTGPCYRPNSLRVQPI